MRTFMPRQAIRPTELWRRYEVLKIGGAQSTTGRVPATHSSQDPPVYIYGIICGVSQDLRERYEHPEHPLTGLIQQQGAPAAAVGDVLKDDSGKEWHIYGVLNPGGLNLWAQYLCGDEPGV